MRRRPTGVSHERARRRLSRTAFAAPGGSDPAGSALRPPPAGAPAPQVSEARPEVWLDARARERSAVERRIDGASSGPLGAADAISRDAKARERSARAPRQRASSPDVPARRHGERDEMA